MNQKMTKPDVGYLHGPEQWRYAGGFANGGRHLSNMCSEPLRKA